MKKLKGFSLKAIAAMLVCLALVLTGCGEAPKASESTGAEKPRVQINMADGGVILVELEPDVAPATVANFLKLVDKGFYDGLTFHRVIPGFMIQGGDPLGTGTGDSGETVKGEFSANGVDNTIAHKRGTLSMARSKSYDSASCQFFITNADAPHLDGQYAAFGRVLEGMDVVDRITAVATDSNDKPLVPVVISSVRRV
ncbi:MAG: peptidylprolyl isomerase [Coriobacteriales bacterium]|jgi:peptidyl-prolyl cis-trans isomerase B (cyclophilin B)|nr:peptidylprolyl isomerase [Coriobacteriales bacterium]